MTRNQDISKRTQTILMLLSLSMRLEEKQKKKKKKLKKNLLAQACTAKYHIEHILHNFVATPSILAIDVVKLHLGHTVPIKK